MEPLDWSRFKPVEPPRNKRHMLTVKVSPSGILNIHPELFKTLKTKKAALFCAKDGLYILLAPDKEPAIEFPDKVGRKRMEEFSRDLEWLGVKLPAVYDMEWREDEGVWFGTCVSQPILPSPVTLAKKYRKEKRIDKEE